MPRTLSWLDRIVPISRSVAESARSHYDRKELQRLFELQPRAAQQLMSALPYVPVGRAKLIQREALSDFLRRLNESDSPAETYARMRLREASMYGGSSESFRSRTTRRRSTRLPG